MEDHYLQRMMGEHEEVILVTRQHWFVLARAILFEIVVALVIFAACTIALLVWLPNSPIILGYFLLVIPLASLARDTLVWSNHLYVVTNRRVIQLSGVINKNVIDSSLEKVNDVKMVQSFFGRLFNYGDVEILTASELGANLFRRIGNPIQFKTAMINAKEHLERLDAASPVSTSDENRPADIPALIAELDKLRQQGILTEAEFQIKKRELLTKI
jgi:uncharacterized membrane protein YdbT with pleckstrin-like domain